MEEKKELILKFIKENKLDFTGEGSDLNSNLVIICGFSLFIGVTEVETLKSYFSIHTLPSSPPPFLFFSPPCWETLMRELDSVFNFAHKNNYGDWWKREAAKKMYKF